MTIKAHLLLLLLIGWVMAIGTTSAADQNPILSAAINDFKLRFAQLPDGICVSVLIETDQDGTIHQARRRLKTSSDQLMPVPSSDTEHSNSQVNWSNDLFLAPDAVPIDLGHLVSETSETWVFDVEPPVGVQWNSEDAEPSVNQNAQQALQTQAVISKADHRLLSLHIFNTKAFKPAWFARIDRIDIRMEFAPAWEKGPLYVKHQRRQVKGRAGYFLSIDEFQTQSISELKLLSLSDDCHQVG